MLIKNKIKFIRNLGRKSERYEHQKFIIEGRKGIEEALTSGVEIDEIYCLEEYRDGLPEELTETVSKKDMERLSQLSSSPGILAIANFMKWPEADLTKGKYIFLDEINDPGNLGSILRIADWYAYDAVICSRNSVDVYNQKVIQASMGSAFRIPLYYSDLKKVLEESTIESFAAMMEGEDATKIDYPDSHILLMGSESHGLNDELLGAASKAITIKRKGSAESLNVAIATGILAQLAS